MTADELLELPDDGNLHELVAGELTTMSPAGAGHGVVSSRIAIRLGQYVLDRKLGETFSSDTGFLLQRDPDTVRAPDTAFVSAARFVRTKKYFPGAPDLAVEVISPTDTFHEVETKVREYLRAGARMVIVINPESRSAIVNTSGATVRLGEDDVLDGGDVVPGWRLPLSELFA